MQRPPITKYRPYTPVNLPDRQWPDQQIKQAPVWCSVDLRDGNQALAVPMTIEEKLKFFKLLVQIGFKEIEVGFPSASDTEFNFCRRLIEEDLIPDDVAIQVLVQAREPLIRRTYEAISGAKQAIVHIYNSTNPLQRRVTFNKSKEEIKTIAVEGMKLVKQLADETEGTCVRCQYSPESFSDTELEFSLEVCEAVMEVWRPTAELPMILNLPATVELFPPNVHADQIEWFCRHLREREKAIISLHTHNDRGTGIAATELGLMAGADRVEGTLFGNGERTGNLDIVTVALNMYTQGVHPVLDFSKLNRIRDIYERTTRMTVHERHPYAGDLVFTAFSGSHQDAIKKGMDQMDPAPDARYQVPYLPIDPADIGRNYKAIIRINSQSGKGGIAFILQRQFGIEMPKKMHPEFSRVINFLADSQSKELTAEEIHEAFKAEYLGRQSPLKLLSYDIDPQGGDHDDVACAARVEFQGSQLDIEGKGNGPIAAFVNALSNTGLKDFKLLDFHQHALSSGSSAKAISYVQIVRLSDDAMFWGAAVDSNIELAGLKGLVSAYNRAHITEGQDEQVALAATGA